MSEFDPKKWLDGYAPGLVKEYVSGLDAALAASEAECERLKTLSKAQYEELSELANDNLLRAESAESRVAELEAVVEGVMDIVEEECRGQYVLTQLRALLAGKVK